MGAGMHQLAEEPARILDLGRETGPAGLAGQAVIGEAASAEIPDRRRRVVGANDDLAPVGPARAVLQAIDRRAEQGDVARQSGGVGQTACLAEREIRRAPDGPGIVGPRERGGELAWADRSKVSK